MKKESIINLFSIGINLAFCFYNLYLGLARNSSWNLSIFVYYVVLFVLKIIACLFIFKEEKGNEGNKFWPFLFLSLLEVALVISFFGPSYLMINNKREIALTTIDGISVATYTFIKVVLSIRNFIKGKRNENCFKVIGFSLGIIDASSSLLTLQNTLILINAKENAASMLSFSMISSIIILSLLLIFLAFVTYKNLKRIKKIN